MHLWLRPMILSQPSVISRMRHSHSKLATVSTATSNTSFSGKRALPAKWESSSSEKLVLDVAVETVAKLHEVWRKEKNNLALSKDMIATIDKHLSQVPIAGE